MPQGKGVRRLVHLSEQDLPEASGVRLRRLGSEPSCPGVRALRPIAAEDEIAIGRTIVDDEATLTSIRHSGVGRANALRSHENLYVPRRHNDNLEFEERLPQPNQLAKQLAYLFV